MLKHSLNHFVAELGVAESIHNLARPMLTLRDKNLLAKAGGGGDGSYNWHQENYLNIKEGEDVLREL
jgi:hypothetical protein